MSRRPIERKEQRRVIKKLTRKPLPAYFDLVEFLVQRRYASSKGKAKEMLLAGRVKHESHTLGQAQVLVKDDKGMTHVRTIVQERVPVSVPKNEIMVLPA